MFRLRRNWTIVAIAAVALVGAAGAAVLFVGTLASAGGAADSVGLSTTLSTTPPPTATVLSEPPTSGAIVVTTTPRPPHPRIPRPHIVWKPIPFPAQRLAETAAYALRATTASTPGTCATRA